MADVPRNSTDAPETLSQFAARVLGQLALSAWLPSAAFVLLIGFGVQLAAEVDDGLHVSSALFASLIAIGRIKLGGLVVLLAVIVIGTMLTQAFSFGAIRLLEGYWGSGPWDRFADRRAAHHRRARARIVAKYRALRLTALDSTLAELEEDERSAGTLRSPDTFDAIMREHLRARVLGTVLPARRLTRAQRRVVDDYDWRVGGGDDFVRRELNLSQRLRDYPEIDAHILPTRLGNVLRRREDDTGRSEVEGLVERVFDRLPLSMQRSHDEQRTRLDLYCSMVFVVAFSAMFYVIRFGPSHPPYAIASAAIGVVLCELCYRAAIASARHYGSVLDAICDYVDTNLKQESSSPGWRGLLGRG